MILSEFFNQNDFITLWFYDSTGKPQKGKPQIPNIYLTYMMQNNDINKTNFFGLE